MSRRLFTATHWYVRQARFGSTFGALRRFEPLNRRYAAIGAAEQRDLVRIIKAVRPHAVERSKASYFLPELSMFEDVYWSFKRVSPRQTQPEKISWKTEATDKTGKSLPKVWLFLSFSLEKTQAAFVASRMFHGQIFIKETSRIRSSSDGNFMYRGLRTIQLKSPTNVVICGYLWFFATHVTVSNWNVVWLVENLLGGHNVTLSDGN